MEWAFWALWVLKPRAMTGPDMETRVHGTKIDKVQPNCITSSTITETSRCLTCHGTLAGEKAAFA